MKKHRRNRHLAHLRIATPPTFEQGTPLPPVVRSDTTRSYTPTVPSPLNPSSPASSTKSRDSSKSSHRSRRRVNEKAVGKDETKGQEADIADEPRPRRTRERPPPVLPPRNRMRLAAELQGSTSWGHSGLEPRPVPMTVTDLGQDYSRYPIPPAPRKKRPSGHRMDVAEGSTSKLPSDASNSSSGSSSSSSEPSLDDAYVTERFASVMDDRINAPMPQPSGYSFPTRLDEKESDDELHMPHENDDITFKPKLRDYCNREGIVSIVGFFVMIGGLICIFVILPVLLYTGVADFGRVRPLVHSNPEEHVNDLEYPLLENIRTGLIDSSTPKAAMTRRSVEGGPDLQLVFSDEFNTPDRTFYPGDDPYWTAPDFWYGATKDLDWYDPDASSTAGGTLNLRLDKFDNHNLTYRSGMLNSWNQLCFKGGALEVSVSLAGPAGVPGLWPGAWTMGNLGRPGYMATTDGIWPYTYNECDVGITPNQSSTDGISYLPGQKLPSCTCPGEDHPTPGRGRGAPEIDVFEAGVDRTNLLGIVTQSYQVAPYDVWQMPDYNYMEMPNRNTTQLNTYTGTPYQQAISGTSTLNHAWYDGAQYQKYAFEYRPGTAKDSHISWFVGEEVSYRMLAQSIRPNGNIGQRPISEEPMTIVLNLGISEAWTFIDWARLKFPTTMRVDYVRLYQEEGAVDGVTCDPAGYETTEYIKQHERAYTNANLTRWDAAGYKWPKHKLNSDCSAPSSASKKLS